MTMSTSTRCVLAAAILQVGFSVAPAQGDTGGGQGDRVSGILAAQEELNDEMSSSRGKYARLRSEAKSKIRDRQARVAELLQGASTLSQLPPDDRVAVVSALEDINALIAENRADHQTCWRERRTGTTMMSMVCATRAERDRLAEDARAFKSNPGVCIPSGTEGAVSCGRIGE